MKGESMINATLYRSTRELSTSCFIASSTVRVLFASVCLVVLSCVLSGCIPPESHPKPEVRDRGVRGGPAGAGDPLPGLTPDESAFFEAGLEEFVEIETVPEGVGPRFNSNQCSSCHSQPGVGGTSPAENPLIKVATLEGARNIVPWFIVQNGPIREARFKTNSDGTPNGGVRALFTISGRRDAGSCSIEQPNFLPAGNPQTGQGGNPNIIFRIPTPVFGAGLIEAIPDQAIIANMTGRAQQNQLLGIRGRPNSIISGTTNQSGNDGTITRFGWKSQNKSLLIFSGEAYNVEMGVTNQLFPQERDETVGCAVNSTPEDHAHFSAKSNTDVLSAAEKFAIFMRLLAPPTPAPDSPSTIRGRALFNSTGCASCHTPSFTTGPMISSGSSTQPSAALSGKPVNLYSDLLIHHMGEGLSDGITQGGAGPDEFRSAPLWGVGQRIFFLHDGRTTNLVDAIEIHRSKGSEANNVVEQFNNLSAQEEQDIINFLRSL
jgi:CxxC motif-containing protein (DUF1111 family)